MGAGDVLAAMWLVLWAIICAWAVPALLAAGLMRSLAGRKAPPARTKGDDGRGS